MFQYVSSLRSLSKGRAQYTMTFQKYDFLPGNVEKELIEKFAAVAAEEDAEVDPDQEGGAISPSVLTAIFAFAACSGVILAFFAALRRSWGISSTTSKTKPL